MTAVTPVTAVTIWAGRIRPHLSGAVESIMAAGRALLDAKEALPHGQFGPLLTELGLSRQHAWRFMNVAQHPLLANVSPGRNLPASVTVLDELTRLPDEELADALDRGDIGPSTTREQARALRPAADPALIGDDIADPDLCCESLDEDDAWNTGLAEGPEWQPSKPDLGGGVSHPARFSPELLNVVAEVIAEYGIPGDNILDPFAGTGRIHELQDFGWETVGIELEPEWAKLHPDTIVGSALGLPFDPESFGAIITSPTYGNRLADHHNASDPERRRSYTHDLGRELSAENSGCLHWRTSKSGHEAIGSLDYRTFHEKAWDEAVLVLAPGGLFVLNCCDHVRDGLVQPVTAWHCWMLGRLGLDYVESRSVETRKLRQGTNSDLREQEQVHVLRKPL